MKYLPSIVAILVAVATAMADPIQALIAAHPSLAALLAAVGAIVAHLSPSPKS